MSTESKPALAYDFEVPVAPSRYLRSLLAYFKDLENWNVDETLAHFDESLVHRVLPASLGRPTRSKESYGALWRTIPQLFSGKFVVTIHEVVESGNKLAVHCSSKSVSARGNPYSNEYSLFIHYVPLPADVDPFSPLGEGEELPKMALVKEFVDSGYSAKFFAEEGATDVIRATVRD